MKPKILAFAIVVAFFMVLLTFPLWKSYVSKVFTDLPLPQVQAHTG